MLSLDTTTRAEFDAATTPAAKAQAVLAALTAPVYVRVYNSSDVLVGSGTMATTWATRSGNVITVGEVATFSVSNTGTPSGWYLRFESGTRWVRGTFGLSGSGADFTWSLATWESGQLGTLGTVTITAPSLTVTTTFSARYNAESGVALAPYWLGAPSSLTLTAGGTHNFAQYARDPENGALTYLKVSGPAGWTVGYTTGVLQVDSTLGTQPVVLSVTDPTGLTATSASCAVTVQVATGFDFYISPTGTGDATTGGTLSNPWPISMLMNSTAGARYAGRRIGLLDGTYVSSNVNFDSAGIRVAYGGSAGAHTVVEAVNPRQAIITGYNGSSYVGEQGLIGVTGGVEYVTFRGLRLTNGGCKGFAIWLSGNVLIENCEVSNFYGSRLPGFPTGDNVEGIRIEQSWDVTIRNCKVFDCHNPQDNWNGSCVKLYNTDRVTAEYCDFYNAAAGFYDKGPDAPYGPRDTVVRYCYIHDLTGADVALPGFDNGVTGTSRVYNNVLVAKSGINPINEGFRQGDIAFYNNTMSITAGGGGAFLLRTINSKLTTFYNNLLVRNGYSPDWRGDLWIDSAAVCPVLDYNCYDSSAIRVTVGASSSPAYTSLASWKSASGKDAASFQANPLFTNTGTGAARYQLQAGSPCKNTGRVGGTSGGAITDIGAWTPDVSRIGTDW